MQKFVSKYALAAHLALLAVAPLILFPYCGARDTALALLWLSLSATLWLFLEPSRRAGEMLHDARVRAARSVFLDPLFWLLVLVAALAATRWANGGVVEMYDPETRKWFITKPAVTVLPGHAGDAGFLEFAVAVAAIPVLMGCRHALGKSARLSFLFTASLVAGLSAVAALAAGHFGFGDGWAASVASDTARSSAGCAFGILFLASFVVLAGSFECEWNKLLLLFSLAIGTTAAGAFWFAPLHAALGFAGAGVLLIIGSMAYLAVFQRPADVLKYAAALIIASVIPVVVALTVAPPEATEAKLAAVKEAAFFPDGFWEMRARLSEIAASVWRGDIWLGAGLGSFPSEARFSAVAADWDAWGGTPPASPANGWWLLLAERGLVGAAALALPFGFMLFTFARRLVGAFGVRSFLPMSALGVVAVALVAADAFFGASFLRPETLLAAGAMFALSASSFPQPRAAVRANDGGAAA